MVQCPFSPKTNAILPSVTAQSLRAAFRRPTSLYTREALVQCILATQNDNLYEQIIIIYLRFIHKFSIFFFTTVL